MVVTALVPGRVAAEQNHEPLEVGFAFWALTVCPSHQSLCLMPLK